MSTAAQQAAYYMDMLPEEDQNFALTFIQKLVLAWDPDYVKLTPSERAQLEKAENEESFKLEDIDWDDPGI